VKKIIPRKVVVQWQFKPDLRVYQVIDQIGLDLLADFADWSRKALELRLLSKERHAAFHLNFRSWTAEISVPAEAEFADVMAVVETVFGAASKNLPIESFSRLGIRLWYGLDLEASYDGLWRRIQTRFYGGADHLGIVLGARIVDNMVLFRMESDDGWKHNFQLGPTSRDEWMAMTVIPDDHFRDASLKTEFGNSLPANPLYVDCDYYRENVPTADAIGYCREAGRLGAARLKKIVDFLRTGATN
jgi:hypothetical protein